MPGLDDGEVDRAVRAQLGECGVESAHVVADDRARLVEDGPARVAVLGHSLGAAVAVLAQDARPRFTRRLVLQDPALLTAKISCWAITGISS